MKAFTKQLTLVLLLSLSSQFCFSQCQSWIKISSPGSSESVWSLATDSHNNVYSTGVFTGSISFADITLVNPTGGRSFYINKFNTNGLIQWAIQIPGTTLGWAPQICQKNGFLYVQGAFADSIVINNKTIKTSRGHWALVILKLDLNGNIIKYCVEPGGLCNTRCWATGIIVNSSNEIYITGKSDGVLSFGSVSLDKSEGYYAYLAKLKPDFSTIWAIQSSSQATEPNTRGWGITLDNNENIVIGGYFTHDIEYGNAFFIANSEAGGLNPYIAKFNSSGKCLWIRGSQGPYYYQGGAGVYSVACDKSNNIYYTSNIETTAIIDGITLNVSNGNFYYCKYTPNGNLIWVKQAGAIENKGATTRLVIDNSNNIWNSGWLMHKSFFGIDTLFGYGVYIAKLDINGNFKDAFFAVKYASPSYSSALDSRGNLYVGGLAGTDTISFQGDTIINSNDTLGVDFVLKYCTKEGKTEEEGKSELGIDEQEVNDDQVSISPNPANDKIIIEAPAPSYISILNLDGKELLQQTITQPTSTINISTLPSGEYLIKVIIKNGVKVLKFLKE